MVALAFTLASLFGAAGVVQSPSATLVLSGGCYWTMEAVFEHVRGVTNVVSGTAGREVGTKSYSRNPTGSLGLAEAVQITFDPAAVSLEDLLRVYFTVAHDPAQVDRQGPDVGTRYRSVVWASNDEQRRSVSEYVSKLEASGSGKGRLVTQIAALDRFQPVMDSEQDFAFKYPTHPYVVAWDRPKLERFRSVLPNLYRERGEKH